MMKFSKKSAKAVAVLSAACLIGSAFVGCGKEEKKTAKKAETKTAKKPAAKKTTTKKKDAE